MFAAAAKEIGAPTVSKKLADGHVDFLLDVLDKDEQAELLKDLRNSVLATAKRFGKARFAQISARHVGSCKDIPPYIRDAVNWLLAK